VITAAPFTPLSPGVKVRVKPFLMLAFTDSSHHTNETGATNCYIQKTEEKHADRHENIDAIQCRVWGRFLIAGQQRAAFKTPTTNGYNAQGVNLTQSPPRYSTCRITRPQGVARSRNSQKWAAPNTSLPIGLTRYVYIQYKRLYRGQPQP